MQFFVSNRGVGTMAGVDDSVVGQGENFLAHHADQQAVAAGGQVAAPHAAFKNQVAADDKLVGFVVQGDAAVAMAGRVKHSQALVAEADFVALFQEFLGRGHVVH